MPRTTIDDMLASARRRLERVSASEARAAQEDGALIVDTRSGDDRRRDGVIPGSLHIPLSVLEWRLDPDADPAFHNPHFVGLEQRIVLVCAHGLSSSLAAARLQELGFAHATDLAGGFAAWRDEGLPIVPATEEPPGALPGMGDPAPS
jgi:rhodanese-related sulfurtransferase